MARTDSIVLEKEDRLSARLAELTLSTPALAVDSAIAVTLGGNSAGRTRLRVLLPENYNPSSSERYPVLYLFHGGTEDWTAWTSPKARGKAEELTSGLPIIVVMPDGGMAGGYADWYNDGAHGTPKWRTYHLEQLIPWIDARYRTIANRTGRAAAGLSMGGGGLRYAAQRPDLFGFTAAFSGDVDITQPRSDWHGAGSAVSKQIWGDYAIHQLEWRGVNGPDLAKNLSNTDVSLFSGDIGKPEETYILPAAKTMDERLSKFGINHQFTIYHGYSHSWLNWNRALAAWLPHLMRGFLGSRPDNSPISSEQGQSARPIQSPHVVPTSFSYSTIDSRYSMYGWSVSLQRKVAEFSALEIIDPVTFSIVGSGSAQVVTPPISWPSTEMQIRISDRRGRNSHKVMFIKAGPAGTITIPVNLGPPNKLPQYSAKADAMATGTGNSDVPFQLFNNGSHFSRVTVTMSATPRGLCDAIISAKRDPEIAKELCHQLSTIARERVNGRIDPVLLERFRIESRARIQGPQDASLLAFLSGWVATL